MTHTMIAMIAWAGTAKKHRPTGIPVLLDECTLLHLHSAACYREKVVCSCVASGSARGAQMMVAYKRPVGR